MQCRRITGRLIGIISVALCIPAAASRAADPDPDNRIDHLVVGDTYWIRVERQDVPQDISGDLVKATDRWIVLARLMEGRSDYGVPVLSSIPHINRLFKNVGIGRVNEYAWIPRDAVTIRGRVHAANPLAVDPPAGDEPSLRADCEVSYIGAENKADEHYGKLEAISENQLTLLESESYTVEVRKPGWSKLPWIGGYFVESRTETREKRTEIARGDLLCIHARIAERGSPAPDRQASIRP
jgi:hypothetical protein